MRLDLFALLVLALAACRGADAGDEAAARARSGPGERRPPNILFIYSDDHATAAVGTYGSTVAPTTNLDRLAEEGVVFDSAFCTNGICAPARAVVLTGRHSHLNGLRTNGDVFDGAQTTFPKLLQAAGYQTALFGKWHLKSDPTGFDRWEILPGQGHYYAPDFRTAEGKTRREGYVTEVTTDLALDWLAGERDPDRPFLLMVQHKAPHRPWLPGPSELDALEGVTIPEPTTLFDDWSGLGTAAHTQEMTIAHHMYLWYDLCVPPHPDQELEGPDRWAQGRFDRMNDVQRAAWDRVFAPSNAAFAAAGLAGDDLVRWKYQRYMHDYLRCIAGIDASVGALLEALDAEGLAEDTIVVYTSDQGFFLGEHGWYDKRFMYEPSLRVPLIVRWPGVTESGRRDDHLVQNLDFAPTFLTAAGVPVPDDMQGTSLVPLLDGSEPEGWRASIYYEYFEVGVHAVEPHFGVRTDRFKLIRYPGPDEWELFDLERDPDEVRSVADDPDYASVRAELTAELERLRDVTGAAAASSASEDG